MEKSTATFKPEDSGFPDCLRSIPSPPAQLYMQGRLPSMPRVAVVGSRDADEYGLRMAGELGAGLAQAGVTVVNGGAAGVDTAALTGCLESGGSAVVVLGTGLDQVYPASNRGLFARLPERGALLTEHAEGTHGLRGHFATRNRIVSGLALGVVVVRAAEKSGSLITARYAGRQGRLLMAVPGQAGERLSGGANWLLRRGAILIESASDVLQALELTDHPQKSLAFAEKTSPVDLAANEDERQMLQALASGPGPIDMMATRSGLDSAKTASLLLQLEIKGLVQQQPGMVYSLAKTT